MDCLLVYDVIISSNTLLPTIIPTIHTYSQLNKKVNRCTIPVYRYFVPQNTTGINIKMMYLVEELLKLRNNCTCYNFHVVARFRKFHLHLFQKVK